jgi:hypothetical protein
LTDAPFSHLSGLEKAQKASELRENGMSHEDIATFMGWMRADTAKVMISKAKKWDRYTQQQKTRWRERRENIPKKPPKNAWPDEVIDRFIELWPRHTADELAPIMSELLGRTVGRGAVTGKARRLNLPPKDRWLLRGSHNGRPSTNSDD